MGPWTLNRVQDVYNKVKDTSPSVVSKSLNKVEFVVQQFIANPEEMPSGKFFKKNFQKAKFD